MNIRAAAPLVGLIFTQAAWADPPAPGPRTLLYSDYSPGTLVVLKAWMEKYASGADGTLVTATNPATFQSRLSEQGWSRILVFARFSTQEPAYAGALRTFATAHPNTPIDFYHWHDHGTAVVRGTAVVADGAWVMWHHGFTSIVYCASKAPPAESLPGHLFPTFEGITLSAPVVVERIDAGGERASWNWVALGLLIMDMIADPCKRDAFTKYSGQIRDCDNLYAEQTALCNSLYPGGNPNNPPGSTPPTPEEAQQWQNCMREASTDKDNCYAAALRRYKLAYRACPTSQPSQ